MLDNCLTFDTETTGLNTAKDQIIEISIQVGLGDNAEVKTRRVKPSIPISAESTEVHGITNDDVKECPSFKQLGNSIRDFFDQVDIIIGYNVAFDLQILQAELVRNKIEPINLSDKHIIDPLNIWRNLRPRKLTDAYKKFCGKELPDAHSAEADVRATAEVSEAMIEFHKAAELGHVDAMFYLGKAYMAGKTPIPHNNALITTIFYWKPGEDRNTVRKDKVRGAKWIFSAAERGHALAMLNFADFLFHKGDKKGAYAWSQKIVLGKARIGYKSLMGDVVLGMADSPIRSHKDYVISHTQLAIIRLKPQLTYDELKEAERAAKIWSPKCGDSIFGCLLN